MRECIATDTNPPKRNLKPPGETANALPSGGFLLGVSDNMLLLDSIALESGQAEKSFATLLTTAGLAKRASDLVIARLDRH
jgi:hypothetical protein